MHDSAPSAATLHVSLEPLRADAAALQAQWRELESRAEPSFFTSWTWIGAWLQSLERGGDVLILRARRAGRLVALATFGHARRRRHGFVGSRGLFLNEADYDGQDVLTIEYNDLLVATEGRAATLRGIADHLLRQRNVWNEIYLHGTPGMPSLFAGRGDVNLRGWSKPAPRVRLDRVRASDGGYLALLKHKPRYQVRRSRRLYEAIGPLTLEIATQLDAARAGLDRLIALHTPYWQSRGHSGSFSKPFERAFHDRLLQAGCARGEIQLVTVRAGDAVVGCLYNFVHLGHVYNYQSGFDYAVLGDTGNPGLVTHAMAIEACAQAGLAVYDFMAGDHRYKRELCTDVEELHWSVVQRRTPALEIENLLRRARAQWLRRAV